MLPFGDAEVSGAFLARLATCARDPRRLRKAAVCLTHPKGAKGPRSTVLGHMKRWTVVTVFLLALAGGVSWYYFQRQGPPSTSYTVENPRYQAAFEESAARTLEGLKDRCRDEGGKPSNARWTIAIDAVDARVSCQLKDPSGKIRRKTLRKFAAPDL